MQNVIRPIMFCALVTLFAAQANGQFIYDFTTTANRKKHDQNLVDSVIERSLRYPLTNVTEKEWRKAFWGMELMLYKTAASEAKLQGAWKIAGELSEEFQKSLLEVSFTLYPEAFVQDVSLLLKQTSAPAVFTRCAEYLLLSHNNKSVRRSIASQLQIKFPGTGDTGLLLLQQRLQPKPPKPFPLPDLFDTSFLPGETIVFSLQRKNRNYPGLVLIRRGDGRFARNSDGTFFQAAQLARAITGYPYYLTNGNTPQGIFRWTGFDTSANSYIGPTPNLQMVMPNEVSPAVFFGDSSLKTKPWTKELYTGLLPKTWQAADALQESWWAGLMGRSEIIMHGTTINPQYYQKQPYFPYTPSLGCLCSYEEWDSNGTRVISEQQKIVDALYKMGSQSGYVVVIDLDDRHSRVSIKEILPVLKRKTNRQ